MLRLKYISGLIMVLTLMFWASMKPAEAIQVISGASSPTVAAGTVINDDLIIFGENEVLIEGTVNGDVFIFAQRAVVNGNIQGDLFAAVQSMDLAGVVADDARIAAQNIRVNGKVSRNLWAAAQDVLISQNGEVGRNGSVTSQSMTLAGAIQGDLYGAMESLNIQGKLGGTGKIHAKDIRLGSAGKIGGDLLYTSGKTVVIEPGGQIAGRTELTEPAPVKDRAYRQRPARALGFVWSILGFISGIIVWAIWKRLWPDSWFGWQRNIKEEPGKSALMGLLLMGGIPFVSLLILITIVGIPLAVITMLVYVIIYYLSHLVIGGVIGTYIYQRLGWQENTWMFPMGYFVVTMLTIIPFLHFFTNVAVFALGLGGISVWALSKRGSIP